MVKVELCEYKGWKDCIRISNDQVELITATKIGPRILRFAFLTGDNVFYEHAKQQGLTGGGEWRIYGGHRLWHGPQIGYRPNEADNDEISYVLLEDGAILTGNQETASGMRKQISIRMAATGAQVDLTHEIINQSVWPVELTAWALTVMAGGGIAMWPNAKQDTGFLPNRVFVTWPYSNPEDPRLQIKNDYYTLRQDHQVKEWFKAGSNNVDGWAAYQRKQTVFLKDFEYIQGENYSDLGSSFEIYTDSEIIELESLSPLTRLEPGAMLRHKEQWSLFTAEELGITLPRQGQVDLDRLYESIQTRRK